jgi:hypothetical protein
MNGIRRKPAVKQIIAMVMTIPVISKPTRRRSGLLHGHMSEHVHFPLPLRRKLEQNQPEFGPASALGNRLHRACSGSLSFLL